MVTPGRDCPVAVGGAYPPSPTGGFRHRYHEPLIKSLLGCWVLSARSSHRRYGSSFNTSIVGQGVGLVTKSQLMMPALQFGERRGARGTTPVRKSWYLLLAPIARRASPVFSTKRFEAGHELPLNVPQRRRNAPCKDEIETLSHRWGA